MTHKRARNCFLFFQSKEVARNLDNQSCTEKNEAYRGAVAAHFLRIPRAVGSNFNIYRCGNKQSAEYALRA